MYTIMVKRKGSGASVDSPFDLSSKKKKVAWCSSDGQKSNIDCTTPSILMQSLLGNTTTDDFFKDHWEKNPLVIKRGDPNFYGTLFTLSIMKEVLEINELDFQADVNVCRYINGEKEFLNGSGQITGKDVDRLIEEKQATYQFHHPQRYIDELWNVMEKMETYFGSLVGSTAYVTPPDSQGLAPHCDDIETFILQIEGEVEWKIYKPMVELSRDYTQDLLQESIGNPTKEVKLGPGDLLYFPRGIIHQCKTVGTGHSTYISIFTYQQNTWGDFMCHAVSRAIENALEDDVPIRSGLPINYLSFLGTGKNMSAYVSYAGDEKSENNRSNLNNPEVIEFKKTVQSHLTKLVEHIDVNTAADVMCGEFMGSRLPPYGHIKDELSMPEVEDESNPASEKSMPMIEKSMPTIADKIKIRYPEHIRLVYSDEDEDLDDEDEDDDTESEEMEQEDEKSEEGNGKDKKSKSPMAKVGRKAVRTREDDDDDDEDAEVIDTEPSIKILHSLYNDRFCHMGFNVYDEVGCLKFNVNFAKAVVELLACSDFVAVKDLLMDEDDDKVLLATKLAGDGLIDIKSE